MRYLLALLLITSCGNDILNKTCPKECWAVEGVSQGAQDWEMINFRKRKDFLLAHGPCKVGRPTCDDDFNIITCDDVLPSVDICDGIDNDCNGTIDKTQWDAPLTRPQNSPEYSCKQWGVCQWMVEVCKDSDWFCDYPVTYEPGNEVSCDGLDNDCDGAVDENLFQECEQWDGSIGPCTCYSGPIGSENLPCHSGFVKCIDGEPRCKDQRLPSAELCNGVDDNCNGVIDDTGDYLSTKYDIIFVLDNSGSTCGEIAAIAGACSEYSNTFEGNPNFRFAIVIMSRTTGTLVGVDTNLSDFSVVRDRLLEIGCNGNGNEASLDSLLFVCDTYENILEINWTPESNKLLFMFTDEEGHTFTSPATRAIDIVTTCLLYGVLPFIWSLSPFEFGPIAKDSNGWHFQLKDTWQPMFNDMNSIVVQLCGGT